MSSRTAALMATIELFEVFKFSPEEKKVFRSYAKMFIKNLSRSSYYKKLIKFERYGLIKKTKDKVFIVTDKAKYLRQKAVIKHNRADGFSTLIMFDIPEKKRKARDTLRRYLIRSGYTQIKESCFLSPFQISDDLKDLIDELNIKEYLSLYSAKMNLL